MNSHHQETKPRVAVIEDEADLRDSIVDFLAAHGYPAWGVESGEALYRRWLVEEVDILILDVNLPGENGFAVAQHASQLRDVAIIILSGRHTVDDRLTGLRCGADRYLVKPLDLRELLANIDAAWRALSRRANAGMSAAPPLATESWRLDARKWTLFSPNGKAMPLTSKEYLLIRCLVDANSEPVAKAMLVTALGGDMATFDYHRIDTTLARLRKKATEATGTALPIKTLQGFGFVFAAQCGLL